MPSRNAAEEPYVYRYHNDVKFSYFVHALANTMRQGGFSEDDVNAAARLAVRLNSEREDQEPTDV